MSSNKLILYLYPSAMCQEIADSAIQLDCNTEINAATIINKQCEIDIITQYKENHFLGSCKIGDLINFNWGRWEYNRPFDEIRVDEIFEYINRGNSIDWMLYCIYISKTDCASKIELYDGLHRLTALKKYIQLYELSKKEDCPLKNQIILISIRINPSLGETIDAFQNINRSISVPDLYIDQSNTVKRMIIEHTINIWTKKYKPHFKSSSKTTIPNINRDSFINIISDIYDHYNIQSEQSLNDLLNKTNALILEKISDYLISERALSKCQKTGCYLFIIKNISLLDFMKQNIY